MIRDELSAFDGLSSLFIVLDADKRVLHWNDAAQALTGISKADARALRLDDLSPPGEHPPLESQTKPFEARWRMANGGLARILWSPPTPFTLDGATGAIALTGIPLESPTSCQHEACTSAIREHVLSAFAHDLKNPLHIIKLTTSVLRRQLAEALPITAREGLEAIENAVDRARRRIQDLLDVTRLEDGRLELELEPWPARTLLGNLPAAARPQLHEKALTIVSDVPDDLPTVRADRERFAQALEKLIENAVRHSPRHGQIRCRAEVCDREVRFSVEDAGPGIDRARLSTLFGPVWQAPSDEQRRLELGLPLAHGISTAFGGRMFIESELGRGTKVTIALPRDETD